MRNKALLIVVGLCCAGCAPLTQIARTVDYQTRYYVQEYRLNRRAQHYARQAWRSGELEAPDNRSKEFKDGYLAGYEGFLSTGSCEPPVTPPTRFWAWGKANAFERSADWYAGYQMGVIAAEQSGLRNQFTVPVSPTIAPPKPLIVGVNDQREIAPLQHPRESIGAPPGNAIEGLPNLPNGTTTPEPIPPQQPLDQVQPPRPADESTFLEGFFRRMKTDTSPGEGAW